MRHIEAGKITKIVSGLCIQANMKLRPDVLSALKHALAYETNSRARDILRKIIDNAKIADIEGLAICQDTGLPCVFVELGQEIRIIGDLKKAIQSGIEKGYRQGYLRNSIVKEPLFRGKPGYQPAVIHFDIVKGDKLKLTVFPKGFGCENKSQLKMFNPTVSIDDIKKFIIEVVKKAGPDACPPYVVGVGIGGTADYSVFLAKKALLRKLNAKHYTCLAHGSPRGEAVGRRALYAKLESELLKAINELNIGPMGLGGKTTCLGVNIETYATHIAGLSVAVNISCHALRGATKEI